MPSKLAPRSIACIFQSTPRTGTARPVIRSTSPGGGDASIKTRSRPVCDFNTRPPCGGRLKAGTAGTPCFNFNPRPPCGGRPFDRQIHSISTYFNPRPPGGGRQALPSKRAKGLAFQSTPPGWGATHSTILSAAMLGISIHAPRVGGDTHRVPSARRTRLFNPRPPCGGRLFGTNFWATLGRFQSMPPMRGATRRFTLTLFRKNISIHAPRVGGDCHHTVLFVHLYNISIHAPRVGGDQKGFICISNVTRFQSTPPVWGATAKAHKFLCRFCSKQRMFPDSSCFKAIIQDMTSENNSAAREN